MKQTSVEHIGRSQLIPGVRRTVGEFMKLTAGLLAIPWFACAHTPDQAPRPATEIYVAQCIKFAMRVAEPADSYKIETPPSVSSGRVLRMVADYSGLTLFGLDVLRRQNAHAPIFDEARISILSVEWPTPTQALVRFGLEPPSGRTCSVRLQPDSPQGIAWSFAPSGEEQCWPRPTRQP
jgi:hypothetical protein